MSRKATLLSAQSTTEATAFVLLAIAAQPERGRSMAELTRMFTRASGVETAVNTLFCRQLIEPRMSKLGHTWFPSALLQKVLDGIHAQDAAVTPQSLRARAAVRGFTVPDAAAEPTPIVYHQDVPVASVPDHVVPARTTRVTSSDGTDSRQRPGRTDAVRRKVVGPRKPRVAHRPRRLAGEDVYAVQDRINYALGVKRMTAAWPEPTPLYILEIIDRNYEAGKTVFATAGEVRGQMVVHGHDTPQPHTVSTVNRTT